MPLTTFIALLRGINVGGRNKILMADLRQLCERLGYGSVQTFIQSGNLVFTATDSASTVEDSLEHGIEASFGLTVPVVVRTAKQWLTYTSTNPFSDASTRAPNHVLLGIPKSRPAKGAATALADLGAAGERVEIVGGALWIFYAGGVGRSKLTPVAIDRLAGSSVTARNWRTVQQLARVVNAGG